MNNIVVLTFHSILNHVIDRPWAFLSESVKAFENTLKYLKKKKYETISLQELYDMKKARVDDNKKRVVLNFDDGFLDNYTIIYPMLKKYGFKGTVYISPEFVDKRDIIRPLAYDDIISGKKIKLEDNWGYLSWNEIKILDESGILDIQGHAMSHTWYFSSDKIRSIHHKGDKYYWLWWNRFPEKKPYWLTQYDETEIEFGYPVFDYHKSLSGKMFIPDEAVIQYVIKEYQSAVKQDGFNEGAFIKEINEKVCTAFNGRIGRYENDNEFETRIRRELIDSKKICEEKLGKKMNFMAWPGGAVSELACKVAEEAGFLAVTSKEKHYNEVLIDDLGKIYRMGGWSGLRFNVNANSIVEKIFIRMQLYRGKGEKKLLNKFFKFLGNCYRRKHIKNCKDSGENWK